MRTLDQRKFEVRKVISKLTEMRISITQYDAIKTLFAEMQKYIQDGERRTLHILFPEMKLYIKGVLAKDIGEQVWVKLEHIPTAQNDDDEVQ